MSEEKEIWKDIPGYDGFYQVSNLGRVKSFKMRTPKIMTCSLTKRGYLNVRLCRDGKPKNHLVHRLVASCFVGCVDDMTVNHIDFDKQNNRVENLEILSIRDNLIHYHKENESSSKYTGVQNRSYSNKTNPWYACINYKGKLLCLGSFSDEYEAHLEYMKYYNDLQNGCSLLEEKYWSVVNKVPSETKHIYQEKDRNKWRVFIDGKTLGRFANLDEAKEFRDNYLNKA